MTTIRQKKKFLVNGAFILLCCAVLLFLLAAPEETTPFLPHDDNHQRFHAIASKKAAEKFCNDCHGENGRSPLAEEHPPAYRCLFCHKRN